MIRVTVELWPGGSEARKRTLGGLDIANVGGTAQVGNYRVWKLNKELRRCKEGSVRGHRRLAESVWRLVAKTIEAVR